MVAVAPATTLGFGEGITRWAGLGRTCCFWLVWGKQRAKARQKAGKIVVVDGDPPWLQHSHPLALGDGAEAVQLGEEEISQGDVIRNNV